MTGYGIGGYDPQLFYQVGEQKTSSRNQSLLWARGDTSQIRFNFMDAVWDAVDWSVEPLDSFDELCKQRCVYLRDTHDWLCLWLSAGYDSQTVLYHFAKHRMPLDEIAFMDRSSYYNDPELPFIKQSAESYKKIHNPSVRITACAVDHRYTASVYHDLQDQWIMQPGISLRYTKSTASFLQRFHPTVVRNRSHTAGNRADIYGKEKPRLDLRDDTWYMAATDTVIEDTIGAGVTGFYLDSACPMLYAKQCYMALHWMESLPDISHELVHRIQSLDPMYYQSWNQALGRVPVICNWSKQGANKQHFDQTNHSFDSQYLIQDASQSNSRELMLFQGVKADLQQDTGLSLLNQSLSSKRWRIRSLEKNVDIIKRTN